VPWQGPPRANSPCITTSVAACAWSSGMALPHATPNVHRAAACAQFSSHACTQGGSRQAGQGRAETQSTSAILSAAVAVACTSRPGLVHQFSLNFTMQKRRFPITLKYR
jgi:hypothetical protein